MNNSFRHSIQHMLKSWRHHASLQLATLLVLMASFTVVVGVISISSNLYKVLTLWGESMQMSVYLNDDINEEHKSTVAKFLNENDNVAKVQFVTQEQALVQFRDQMASYAPDLLNDKDLIRFIPASFQFSINKKISPSDQLNVMRDLASQLETKAGVDEVSYGQDWVKSYSGLFQALTWIGGFFIFIILSSAVFVMSNSIHSSIQQRRTEIEILELIGATAKYIRRPFMWEGAMMGGISATLALLLGLGLFSSLKNYLSVHVAFLQLSSQLGFISFEICIALIGFAMAMGAIASYICVRKINNGWAASQFAKET